MKKGFKSSSFFNIFNLISYLISNIIVLFEVHKRFKGHFLNELRISFNEKKMQGATHERNLEIKKIVHKVKER